MKYRKSAIFALFVASVSGVGQNRAQAADLASGAAGPQNHGLFHMVNVFSGTGVDNRVPMQRSTASGLSPVGAVDDTVSHSYGTAFLISSCHVLTNYHVALPTDRVSTSGAGSDLTFYIGGPSGGQPYTDKTHARVVAWGNYVVNDGGRIHYMPINDWAVLKLDACLGARYGYMDLTPMPAPAVDALGLPLATAGFPGDHAHDVLWGVHDCEIHATGFGAMWLHDCSTTEGSSGSPIFFRDATGSVHVVAMVSAAIRDVQPVLSRYDSAAANVAVPIDGIYDRLQPFVETAPATRLPLT